MNSHDHMSVCFVHALRFAHGHFDFRLPAQPASSDAGDGLAGCAIYQGVQGKPVGRAQVMNMNVVANSSPVWCIVVTTKH